MVHVPAVMQAVVLVLAALLATAVALTRNVLRQIVVNGVYGLMLVILFVVLQAPDVALSMLVVTAVAYPVIVLAAIGRTRKEDEES
jgi:energy-converting hydrogenase B subunit D